VRCYGIVNDLQADVGLLEVTVLGTDDDLAAKEEQDVDLELGPETNREPDSVLLRCIDYGESQTRQIRTQKRAHRKGYLARHGCAHNHRLVGAGIDIGVPFPAVFVLLFRAKTSMWRTSRPLTCSRPIKWKT
jgi:hypothetical protein